MYQELEKNPAVGVRNLPSLRRILRKIEEAVAARSRPFIRSDIQPTIIASIGRSGSTLVYHAVSDGVARARFSYFACLGRRVVRGDAWELGAAKLENGVVYKTHDFPYEIDSGGNIKAIFLYRRPSDTILSLYRCLQAYGRDWVDVHLSHLHAKGTFEDLLHGDILRYQEQISAWSSADNIDVLGLQYEALWDHAHRIREFLGIDVVLPARRVRKRPSWEVEFVARVRDAYRSLDDLVAAMPDYFLTGPAFRKADLASAVRTRVDIARLVCPAAASP